MKTKAKQPQPDSSQAGNETKKVTNFKQGYLLKGSTLQPLAAEPVGDKPPVERKFKSSKELEQIVLKNSTILFGQQSFLLSVPKKKGKAAQEKTSPDFFMLEMGDFEKPRIYFIAFVLLKQDLYGHVFPRITKFHLNEKELLEMFYKLMEGNKGINHLLQTKKGSKEVVERIGKTKPSVLLIADGELTGLSDLAHTYPMWQNVKPLAFRKYASGKEVFITSTPAFAEIHHNGVKRQKGVPLTEEEHLKKTSEEVRVIYKRIKAELLAVNNQLQFNSQRYYISLRNNRNLAFFHFSKNRITLVVKYPEKETRKKIKSFEILSLAASVQKFWGAASCSIVIDKKEHLREVIELLKMLVK